MITKLFVFGGSSSTPDFQVDSNLSWWGKMALELGVDRVMNYSWPGNNLESILHIIVSSPDMFNKNDYVVIGVPPVERATFFDEEKSEYYFTTLNKTLNESMKTKVQYHESLKQLSIHQLGKEIVNNWNRSWAEAIALRSIITALLYIEKQTPNVLITNLSKPFQTLQEKDNWPVLEGLQKQAENDPRIMLFKDTYFSVNYKLNKPVDFTEFGWHGHHGPVGNQHWYDTSLKPKMKELGWI